MAYKTKIGWLQRVEPELKERLEVIAKRNKRSLNNMVEVMLEEVVAQYEADLEPIEPQKTPAVKSKKRTR